MFINELVCEGCGDCSKKSNCISIEPQETEFGRKRKINQSSCNKDFSCLKGFCPSLVTVEGGNPCRMTTNVSNPRAEVIANLLCLVASSVGNHRDSRVSVKRKTTSWLATRLSRRSTSART